ncbi:MAG TPA: hypothetical protein VF557_02215 [Jatrophihabitans sp.]|jgi:hypothetical protein|uniref:hypothetical protein n=1 Tax=Jatrophihabitans sp. TaxID=1932789 RepID=UPI002F15770D
MQALKMMVALIASLAGLFVLSSPAAAADPYRFDHLNSGDYVLWNAETNTLAACDKSSGNGTAMAMLEVVGGTTKQVIDGNGAQPGCGSATFYVDETKYAYLWICTNPSMSSCYRKGTPVPL